LPQSVPNLPDVRVGPGRRSSKVGRFGEWIVRQIKTLSRLLSERLFHLPATCSRLIVAKSPSGRRLELPV
jgi:hypothetical protein